MSQQREKDCVCVKVEASGGSKRERGREGLEEISELGAPCDSDTRQMCL